MSHKLSTFLVNQNLLQNGANVGEHQQMSGKVRENKHN